MGRFDSGGKRDWLMRGAVDAIECVVARIGRLEIEAVPARLKDKCT